MGTFYKVLVFIHIFSAILGLGPGFFLIHVVTKAKTMTELRYAYKIRKSLHIFVMIGGTLLLLTGLLMGAVNPSLFKQIWYLSSIILFLIALATGPILLSPWSRRIKALLASSTDENIPEEYLYYSKVLFRYERLTSLLFLIVIALMILKP